MGVTRIIWWAALFAGASYVFAAHFTVPEGMAIAWKGAGVGLLAAWCALQADSRDGWLITAVMTCGAAGDVLLEAVGQEAGAAAFAIGHALACVLYIQNTRESVSPSERASALTVLLVTPLLSYLLTFSLAVVFYAALLGLMASRAWQSRFPRYRTGIGAMLFLASDLLIFAKMGPMAPSPLPGLLIWPLYFCGQALIAWGVVKTLEKEPHTSLWV